MLKEIQKDIDRLQTLILESRLVTRELAEKYRVTKPRKPMQLVAELETDIQTVLDALLGIEYKIKKNAEKGGE